MPSLLLVDDEEDIRESLVALLEAYVPAADVTAASSGEAALALVSTCRFDVVLSDLKMPGMNGLEFLEAAREEAPAARFFLMTAFPLAQIEARVPGTRVIAKPFKIPELLDVLGEALSSSQPAAP